MKNNFNKGWYEIVDNQIQIVDTPHPYLSIKDKSIFINKFIDDLNLDKNKVQIIDNRILCFNFNNIDYQVFIEHVDGGGKDTTDIKSNKPYNAKKKISIPFPNKPFRKLITEFKKVLVINLYFPLTKKDNQLVIDENNYFYYIVKPTEIYSSKVVRKYLISKNKNDSLKWNTSNRWARLIDAIELNNSNEHYLLNKKSNAFIVTNKNIKNFFKEKIIYDDYLKMLDNLNTNIYQEMKNEFNNNKLINDNLISKHRQIFRNKLYEVRSNRKCDIENCNIDLDECLIASHIKAVNEIIADNKLSDKEKIFQIQDPNNGLLLCRNHDCLFDKHLISFDSSNGYLIAGSYIKKYLNLFELQEDKKTINLVNDAIKEYMEHHKKIFEKKVGKS